MKYFDFMPIINYGGTPVRDITRRSILSETYRNNPYVFLPYTIHPGERPIDIANVYYGSIDKTWLVLMSQRIIDPYYEWPMDATDFAWHLSKKYQINVADKSGLDIVEWSMNPLYDDNILHYVKINEEDIRISKDGYLNLTEEGAAEYRAVRIFEQETILNEQRRSIRLIDRGYMPQIEREIRKQMAA